MFGMISLVVYQGYALAFLMPTRTAQELARDMSTAISKAAHGGVLITPAIIDYLRRRCSSWIDDMQELGRVLVKERADQEGVTAVIGSIMGVLGYYGRVKVRIPDRSSWFPPKTVEVSPDQGWFYFDQRRIFRSLGLGRPTTTARNMNWLEDRVFRLVRELVDAAHAASLSSSLVNATIALGALGQDTAETEEIEIMAGVLAQLESLSGKADENSLSDWGAHVINAWLSISDAHLKRLQDLRAPETLGAVRWRNPGELAALKLPRLQNEIVREMFAKLTLERDYEGHLVTPTSHIKREVDEAFESRIAEWHREVLTRIAAILHTCRDKAFNASWPHCSAAWTGVQLLLATRSFALGQLVVGLEVATDALPNTPRAYMLADGDRAFPRN
jgi:hypothetical protein